MECRRSRSGELTLCFDLHRSSDISGRLAAMPRI
jgi:hypothetical protein